MTAACDDRERSVPRTDVVLADPRLAEATARLGPITVKTRVARCAAGPRPRRH